MNDMLDENLDLDLDDDSEVQDIIAWQNPEDGRHRYIICFIGQDNVGTDEEPIKGVRVIYQYIETLQDASTSGLKTSPGSLFSERFTGHTKSKQWFKKRLSDCYGEGQVKPPFGPYVKGLAEKKPVVEIVTKIVQTQGKGDNKGRTFDNVRIQDFKVVDVTLPEDFEVYEYEPNLEVFDDLV